MLGVVPRRPPPVHNLLPDLLRAREVSWTELARRTLLPARLLRRLRGRSANPYLAVAERVAAALEVRVEDLWRLARGPGR
jgi:hypothetical protein